MHREDPRQTSDPGERAMFARLVRSIEELLIYSGLLGDGRGRSEDIFRFQALRFALLLGWGASRTYLAEHIRRTGANLGLDIATGKANAFAIQLELIYKDCTCSADGAQDRDEPATAHRP